MGIKFSYKFKDLVLLNVLSVLLFLLGLWGPLVILAVVPIVILVKIYGLKWGLFNIIGASVVISLIANLNIGAIFILEIGVLSLLLGSFIKRDYASVKIIVWGTIVLLATSFILISLAEIVYKYNFWKEFQQEIVQSSDLIYNYYKQLGYNKDQLEIIKKASSEFASLVRIIFPSLMLLFILVAIFIDYILSKAILKHRGYSLKSLPSFSSWKLNDLWVWGFIVSCLLVYASPKIGTNCLEKIGYNGLVFFGFLYLVQGLSVVNFYLENIRISRFFKILFYILLLWQKILVLIVVFLGLFDTWFNWRKIQFKIKR